MVPTTSLDDFWLYDYPINPINIPSCIVFGKPKDRTPQQMMDQILNSISLKSRTRGTMVKIFGKYFIKDMKRGSKEYEKWLKEGTGILYDIKTDQDILDFFCKLKKLELKG